MTLLRKLVIAQFVLGAGLATIFALPRTYESRPSAIVMSLPTFVGTWRGVPLEVAQRVKEDLADDTGYQQKLYNRFAPGQPFRRDVIYAFIVLSGADMNNSIHRPERCYAAQGYTLRERHPIEITLDDGRSFKAMRLLSTRPDKTTGREVKHISYYWFTGAEEVTNNHYRRTWIDMRDRLLTGTNQRWAYVTLASEFGQDRGPDLAARNEAETDAMLQQFTRDLFARIHNPDVELQGVE